MAQAAQQKLDLHTVAIDRQLPARKPGWLNAIPWARKVCKDYVGLREPPTQKFQENQQPTSV